MAPKWLEINKLSNHLELVGSDDRELLRCKAWLGDVDPTDGPMSCVQKRSKRKRNKRKRKRELQKEEEQMWSPRDWHGSVFEFKLLIKPIKNPPFQTNQATRELDLASQMAWSELGFWLVPLINEPNLILDHVHWSNRVE